MYKTPKKGGFNVEAKFVDGSLIDLTITAQSYVPEEGAPVASWALIQ